MGKPQPLELAAKSCQTSGMARVTDTNSDSMAPLGGLKGLLVRFGPQSVPDWEIVYNIETPWPDDARVIRAHDLGEERFTELPPVRLRHYQRHGVRAVLSTKETTGFVAIVGGRKLMTYGNIDTVTTPSGTPASASRPSAATAAGVSSLG